MKFVPDITYVQQIQRSKYFRIIIYVKLIQITFQGYLLSENLVKLVVMGILLLLAML